MLSGPDSGNLSMVKSKAFRTLSVIVAIAVVIVHFPCKGTQKVRWSTPPLIHELYHNGISMSSKFDKKIPSLQLVSSTSRSLMNIRECDEQATIAAS